MLVSVFVTDLVIVFQHVEPTHRGRHEYEAYEIAALTLKTGQTVLSLLNYHKTHRLNGN